MRVVVNRYDKNLARTISKADVREALGREVAYTIANDFPLVRAAIDQGVPIDDVIAAAKVYAASAIRWCGVS